MPILLNGASRGGVGSLLGVFPSKEKLAREMTHRQSYGQTDPRAQAMVDYARVTQDPSYVEPGLQGGVPTENVTGLGLSPLDIVPSGLMAKGVALAKMFGVPLAAALGATGIASRASQGAKLPALAEALPGQREGFARGGSPDTSAGVGMTKDNTMDFARRAYEQSHQTSGDPLLEELLGGAKGWDELTPREQLGWIDQGRMMAYRNLAGEAEARLTQARMNMTPEERLANYPVSMFDVPVEQQIVRYGEEQQNLGLLGYR